MTRARLVRSLRWRLRRLRHRYGRVVGPGSRADRVTAVQRLVNDVTDAGLRVDGVYGGQTRNGVRRLQRQLGLPPTSWADPVTIARAVGVRARRAERTDLDARYGDRLGRPLRIVTLDLPQDARRPDSAGRQTVTIVAPVRDYIPQVLERDGLARYEPDTLATWLAALETRPPGPVLDIGANIGVFSFVASALFSEREVVAFEPTPDLADAARVVAEVNQLGFTVDERALGDGDGTATLYLSQSSDSSNSLAEGFRPATGAIEVPVERLDAWCARHASAPVLMKVDTETTEPAVLRGGTGTIARLRPWIICEILREVGRDVADILGPLGYHWHRIDDARVFPVRDRLDSDKSFHYLNWLLTPEPVPEPFWTALARWRAALAATQPAA